jgi:hypothetical protein
LDDKLEIMLDILNMLQINKSLLHMSVIYLLKQFRLMVRHIREIIFTYRTVGMHCGCQPYAPAALYPQEDSWYSFLLEAESTPRP